MSFGFVAVRAKPISHPIQNAQMKNWNPFKSVGLHVWMSVRRNKIGRIRGAVITCVGNTLIAAHCFSLCERTWMELNSRSDSELYWRRLLMRPLLSLLFLFCQHVCSATAANGFSLIHDFSSNHFLVCCFLSWFSRAQWKWVWVGNVLQIQEEKVPKKDVKQIESTNDLTGVITLRRRWCLGAVFDVVFVQIFLFWQVISFSRRRTIFEPRYLSNNRIKWCKSYRIHKRGLKAGSWSRMAVPFGWSGVVLAIIEFGWMRLQSSCLLMELRKKLYRLVRQ